MTGYCAVLRRTAGGYALIFPDLPGCGASGDSPEALRLAAPDVLKEHLQALLLAGRPLPPSRSWSETRAACDGDPDVLHALPVLTQL